MCFLNRISWSHLFFYAQDNPVEYFKLPVSPPALRSLPPQSQKEQKETEQKGKKEVINNPVPKSFGYTLAYVEDYGHPEKLVQAGSGI